MGSIQHIYNLEKWKVLLEGKSVFLPDDDIYKMSIGWCDDELSLSEICVFISRENYENLLNGKYFFKKFPYSNQKIIIFDNDNNIIPLVKGKVDDEYSTVQKEYVKKLRIR